MTFYNKEHPPKGILVIQNNVFGALFPVFILTNTFNIKVFIAADYIQNIYIMTSESLLKNYQVFLNFINIT